MNVLRDPIWQFVGVAIAVVALLISIIPLILRRGRKAISYYYFSDVPLSVPKGEENDFKLLYKGEPIDELSNVFLRLYNSAATPILPDDFHSPISFDFGEHAKILQVTYGGYPNTLQPVYTIQSNNLSLAPIMLNKGDGINFHLKVAGFNGRVSASGRIAGVPKIKSEDITHSYRANRPILYDSLTETYIAVSGFAFLLNGGWWRVLGAVLIGLCFSNDIRKLFRQFGKRPNWRFELLLEILLPFLVYGVAVAIAYIF
jgi:hypothetical protein